MITGNCHCLTPAGVANSTNCSELTSSHGSTGWSFLGVAPSLFQIAHMTPDKLLLMNSLLFLFGQLEATKTMHVIV